MPRRFVTFKANVRVKRLTPALIWIFEVLDRIQNLYSDIPELVITSVNDSNHSPNSRHYKDEAIDIRTHYFKDKKEKDRFISLLDAWLNKDPEALRKNAFTILHESVGTVNEHIHVQVKKNESYP